MAPILASPYLLAPLVSAVTSGLLVAVAWRHRSRAVAIPFLALMSAICLWSVAYWFQLNATTLGAARFWLRFGTTFAAAIPTFWIVLTLEYSERTEWLTAGSAAALVVDPIAMAALIWTNGSHHLVWQSMSLDRSGKLAVLTFEFGPGWWVHIVYAYLLVVAGILLLVVVFMKASRIYRRQAGLLVVGAVVPLGANVAFTFGVSPIPELDLTTSTFTLTGVFFATALFSYDFLDLTPVAHENLLDELGDGVVTLTFRPGSSAPDGGDDG